MQQLTAAPRDGLTSDQVTGLLVEAPAVVYGKGCELLDASLNVLEDLSSDFEGGTIDRVMAATVHGTCTLNLARDVDYGGSQLLRPYMTISDGTTTAKFYTGVFVPRKPTTSYGTSPIVNQITGSDRLFLLNRPVGDAYAIGAGVDYLTAVAKVITDAGLTGVLLDSTAAGKTLPAPQTWPLLTPISGTTPTSSPVDVTASSTGSTTTWLQIVNDLLAAINYRGLWCDETGMFRSQPYADPATRAVEFAFTFDDAYQAVVAPARTVTQDLSTVPNVWIFQQQNLTDASGSPLEPTEGAGQYTVTNQSDGPTSIDARGGGQLGRWPLVVQLTAADQPTLAAQGNARVAADKRTAKELDIKCAPFPAAGHWDVYTYTDAEALGGLVKVEEVEWHLDLGSGTAAPADMTRKWQVIS